MLLKFFILVAIFSQILALTTQPPLDVDESVALALNAYNKCIQESGYDDTSDEDAIKMKRRRRPHSRKRKLFDKCLMEAMFRNFQPCGEDRECVSDAINIAGS